MQTITRILFAAGIAALILIPCLSRSQDIVVENIPTWAEGEIVQVGVICNNMETATTLYNELVTNPHTPVAAWSAVCGFAPENTVIIDKIVAVTEDVEWDIMYLFYGRNYEEKLPYGFIGWPAYQKRVGVAEQGT